MYDMYGIIEQLCSGKGIKPGKLCSELGISRGTLGDLKAGRTKKLSAENVSKIANYFGVTTDYLMNGGETEKAPTLTNKDERDIAKDLELIMSNLESAEGLMFDGNPMSDEARESMRAAIEIGLKTVKILNKETYTPKKYKKG